MGGRGGEGPAGGGAFRGGGAGGGEGPRDFLRGEVAGSEVRLSVMFTSVYRVYSMGIALFRAAELTCRRVQCSHRRCDGFLLRRVLIGGMGMTRFRARERHAHPRR